MKPIVNSEKPKNKGGRPKGSRLQRTVEVALQLTEDGKTPLQIMLEAMRAADQKNDTETAVKYASLSAPYCHPKLASTEVSGKGGGPLRVELAPDAALLARLDAIEKSLAA